MNLDYGHIFSRAWEITWKNKILWVFAFLFNLSSSRLNTNFNIPGGGGGGGGQGGFDRSGFREFLERFNLDANTLIAIGFGLFCLLLLVSLVFWLLSAIGQGGLIGGVRQAEATGQVSFGEAWGLGTEHFMRLFLIRLVAALPGLFIVLLALVGGATVAVSVINGNFDSMDDLQGGGLALALVCLIGVACLMGLAAFALQIALHYAPFAAVIEGLGTREAMSRSWAILVANFVPTLILAVILAIIDGVVGFVLAIPLIAIILPAVIALAVYVYDGRAAGLPVAGFAALCCVIYAPILAVLASALQTWKTSTWVLAYQTFIRPAAPPPSASMLAPEGNISG